MTSMVVKNKKGIVLVELIASVMMMGLIGTMLAGSMLFVFKSLQLSNETTRQNNATIFIAQTISNEITGWNPTNIDETKSTSTKIVFTRSEYFYEDSDGITIRIQLDGSTENPYEELEMELITTGTHAGKIRFSFTGNEHDPAFTRYIDTDNNILDLDKTKISYSVLSKTTAQGKTQINSYLVSMNIVTSSPTAIEVPISIPVIVKN